MNRVRSLADLKLVQKQLAEQRRRAAEALAAQQASERRAQAEANLFRRAAGEVTPLRHPPRIALTQEPAAPIAVQHQLDEQRVLHESLSDEFDASTLLDVDDAMSYRRPGVGADVTRKLRRGEWSIQRQIDLHGLRRDDARDALGSFIREAHRHGIRCVRGTCRFASASSSATSGWPAWRRQWKKPASTRPCGSGWRKASSRQPTGCATSRAEHATPLRTRA